jgi:hypothetical protein
VPKSVIFEVSRPSQNIQASLILQATKGGVHNDQDYPKTAKLQILWLLR